MEPADFFRQNLENARRVSQRTGIDPRLVLAQTALETGYGRSAPNNNFFGIKGRGSSQRTQEFRNGAMVSENANFRAYDDPSESFDDWADLMLRSSRYEPVRAAGTLEDQIAAMAASGYATDPNYGAKLSQIAGSINLDGADMIGADALSAIGRGSNPPAASRSAQSPAQSAMPQASQQREPRGILEALGIQKMEEGAAGEDGQRFYQRDTFKDTAARMSQAFAALGTMPSVQKFADGVASERTETKARNKTVAYLRRSGNNDLADMIEAGNIGATEAMSALFSQRLAPPADGRTSVMKNYEFFLSQGMSPEAAQSAVQSGTTINLPGGEDAGEFAKRDVAALVSASDAGLAANRSIAQIDRLEGLLQNVNTGGVASLKSIAGGFGLQTEGLSDIQAANAIISQLVPQQRAPGSGPMSDADLALFKQSLPSLINSPQGNAMILQTMRGLAQYDAMGGAIVQKYRSGESTQAEAYAALLARPDPFANFSAAIGSPTDAAGGAGSTDPTSGINEILGQ